MEAVIKIDQEFCYNSKMNKPDENYVFHGSHEKFDIAIPKRNRRMKKNDAG